jgi:hypothetical protein
LVYSLLANNFGALVDFILVSRINYANDLNDET